MNRIWISRNSSIPIREQLSAQLLFGIVSRRFGPSERLPSVRDLARRLKVHPNTVSAAYRDLAARGWVKGKAGSGVFVCAIQHSVKEDEIDTFMQAWMEEGVSRGFSLASLHTAFEKAGRFLMAQQNSRSLLVMHQDRNLARILAAEIEESVGCDVGYATAEDASQLPDFETHILLTTTSGAEAVSRLGKGYQLILLKSMEEVLAGLGRPTSPVLIGMVSRSETILRWAALLIPALGLTGGDLIHRNPEQAGWQQGLAACDLIAADILAARELPAKLRPIVFRLVSDSFLEEARRLVKAEKA